MNIFHILVYSTKLANTLYALLILQKCIEERKQILEKLSIQTRRSVEKKLNYPKDSAARLMQSYFITVLDTWSVGQVIHYLQEIKNWTHEE